MRQLNDFLKSEMSKNDSDFEISESEKYLPQAHHSVGVQLAISQKLLFNLGFAFRRGIRVDGFQKSIHRHAAILHAIQCIVT